MEQLEKASKQAGKRKGSNQHGKRKSSHKAADAGQTRSSHQAMLKSSEQRETTVTQASEQVSWDTNATPSNFKKGQADKNISSTAA